jgi:hypothetical protein
VFEPVVVAGDSLYAVVRVAMVAALGIYPKVDEGVEAVVTFVVVEGDIVVLGDVVDVAVDVGQVDMAVVDLVKLFEIEYDVVVVGVVALLLYVIVKVVDVGVAFAETLVVAESVDVVPHLADVVVVVMVDVAQEHLEAVAVAFVGLKCQIEKMSLGYLSFSCV